jgi:hypothetical protein
MGTGVRLGPDCAMHARFLIGQLSNRLRTTFAKRKFQARGGIISKIGVERAATAKNDPNAH